MFIAKKYSSIQHFFFERKLQILEKLKIDEIPNIFWILKKEKNKKQIQRDLWLWIS